VSGYRDMEFSGGCQCGAVRFRARGLGDNPHICYCRMCQKAMGNLGAALVSVTDLTWTRGTPAIFTSSHNVHRGFCRDCGTPLFVRNVGAPYGMTIGSFDTPHAIPILIEMGTEGKHPSLPEIPGAVQEGATEDNEDPRMIASIVASNRQHPDHDTAEWPPAGRA
jgi:hypothetical protein